MFTCIMTSIAEKFTDQAYAHVINVARLFHMFAFGFDLMGAVS